MILEKLFQEEYSKESVFTLKSNLDSLVSACNNLSKRTTFAVIKEN